MKLIFLCLSLFFLISVSTELYSQEDSIEVYLIESYVSPKIPHNFFLSFFTSDYCKTKVIIENAFEFEISIVLEDDHKAEIPISDLKFIDKNVPFVILTEDSLGNISHSEEYEFVLPYEPEIKEGSNLLTLCLFGGIVFLLPNPVYVYDGNETYFSLTKEIPVLSFRSKGYNYPAGYLSLEYSYIFSTEKSNYLRAGYKQIFGVGGIEYLLPGISLFTNFSGNNGVSPELSLGLFTIEDSFTFYTRYRYNIDLSDKSYNFSEISIGLYSSYFSFYPD
ncbi:MAG TPA: hypothetical protein VH917_01640 [Ignavibacteriaceae bacterium]|jgi:hypothetical protein